MAVLLCIIGLWIVKSITTSAPDSGIVSQIHESSVTAVPSESFVPLELTSAFALTALTNQRLPVVIDFGADSCVPCKEMAPVLTDLNRELAGKAIIHFVDVWKYRNLANSYPIRVIPTQVLFNADGSPFLPPENYPLPLTMYTSLKVASISLLLMKAV